MWLAAQIICNTLQSPQNENVPLLIISTLFFGFIWGLIINYWMFGKIDSSFTPDPRPLKIISLAMTKTLRKIALPIATVLMLPISYLILSNNNTDFSNYFKAFAFVLVSMSIVLHYKVLNNRFIVDKNQLIIQGNHVLFEGDKFIVNQVISINVPILLPELQEIELRPIGDITCLEGEIRDVILKIQASILFNKLNRNLSCNYKKAIKQLENNCINNLLTHTSKDNEKTFVQKVYDTFIDQETEVYGWHFKINKVTVQFELPQQNMN